MSTIDIHGFLLCLLQGEVLQSHPVLSSDETRRMMLRLRTEADIERQTFDVRFVPIASVRLAKVVNEKPPKGGSSIQTR
jgi:hypothetical protein